MAPQSSDDSIELDLCDGPEVVLQPQSNQVESLSAVPQTDIKHEALSVGHKSEINGSGNDETSEPEYPTGLSLAFITLGLCLAIFLTGLDRTVLATAIPKITSQFHSLDDIGWYGSSYLLTTCSSQLFYGKLYGYASIKWTFMTSIMIFELGSVICGSAPNSVVLIVGRAIAGLGCAGIGSGALMIVTRTVPLRQRPIYTGMIGGMMVISSVVGPLIGGLLTDNVTWRWCFYLNCPVGALTVVVIGILFKNTANSQTASMSFSEKLRQCDILGTTFFVPAIVCLLLTLQWGGNTYAWSNWRIILLMCLFGLLILIWTYIQIKKGDQATLPPRIISQRSIACGVWFTFCLGSAFLVMTYFLPVWFQAIKGTTATQSGINYLSMAAPLSVFTIVAGIVTSKIGYYVPMMIASSVLAPIGAGLISTFTTHTSTAMWVGSLILFGAGVGMGMQQTLMVAQTVLTGTDTSVGIATVIFAQALGGTIFISVGQSIFANKLISGLQSHVPEISPAAVIGNGAYGLAQFIETIGPQYVSGVLLAYNDAIVQVFYISVVLPRLAGRAGHFFLFRQHSAEDDQSQVTFGGVDRNHFAEKSVKLSIRRKGQWHVVFNAITFGSGTIQLSNTGAALDTGASLIGLPTALAKHINERVGSTRHSNRQYTFDCGRRSGLPDLIFTFSGHEIAIGLEDYIFNYKGGGVSALMRVDMPPIQPAGSFAIIGTAFCR
ncbi:hypothetical protein MMC11_008075 [Xylographa trunciseda]|nr:hypothetical protein [Xylographa trunciseda]